MEICELAPVVSCSSHGTGDPDSAHIPVLVGNDNDLRIPLPDPSGKIKPTAVGVASMDIPAREPRQVAFAEAVRGISETMRSTPLGWALVAWLAHWQAPPWRIAAWVGVFVPIWLVNVFLLRRVAREGSDPTRHSRLLWIIAALDGIAWGLAVPWLMGIDRTLDSWMAVVLCGVASVNAPAYITEFNAFRALLLALWLTVLAGAATSLQATGSAIPLSVGITVYLVVLIRGMRIIANRVTEGIRLAIENASLASHLERALELSKREATTDALTGVANRRSLDEYLAKCVERNREQNERFGVLLLDLDHFKQINDRHGHMTGDRALRAAAQRIQQALRVGDMCARYGGEEFFAVLPRVDSDMALEVAERIRRTMESQPLLSNPTLRATVSIGVAICDRLMTVEQLIAAADAAVYAAKHNGRNQVQLGSHDAAPVGVLRS
ncbi:MAG: GGDEF domain-containing protein [Xanthomonadaceae bacterium]|nr:GGDEF domain-containing protein [Xanthomonadaceae bacterium]